MMIFISTITNKKNHQCKIGDFFIFLKQIICCEINSSLIFECNRAIYFLPYNFLQAQLQMG